MKSKNSMILLVYLCILGFTIPAFADSLESEGKKVHFKVTGGYYIAEDGDLDDGIVFGMGFSYKLKDRHWLVLQTEIITCDIKNTLYEADFTKLHLTYFVHPREGKKTIKGLPTQLYFGGGLTLINANYPIVLTDPGKDTPLNLGFNVTAGLNINDLVNLELRYEIMDDENLGGGKGVLEMGGITGTLQVQF